MRQKKYRLEIVLNVREKKKEEAARFVARRRQELLDAERELNRREKFLAACRRQLVETNDKLMSEYSAGAAAGKIVSHRDFLQVLKEREEILKKSVAEQINNVRYAEQLVEEALAQLAEAFKELRIIEKHKEHWQATQKQESQKREQKLNDEIGAILHRRSEKL
jgi:flagellar export protein FliJ